MRTSFRTYVLIFVALAAGRACFAQELFSLKIPKKVLIGNCFLPVGMNITQLHLCPKENSFHNASPLFSTSSILQQYKAPVLGIILPEEAIFCKMENQLHKRWNIWIKLRAGDDATYQKVMTMTKR